MLLMMLIFLKLCLKKNKIFLFLEVIFYNVVILRLQIVLSLKPMINVENVIVVIIYCLQKFVKNILLNPYLTVKDIVLPKFVNNVFKVL